MPTLTNSYDNCQLLNVGDGPQGRGPFIIRQQGSAPGSMTLDQNRYFLRKDGTWVLSLAVYILSEAEQEINFLYSTSADAMKQLSSLTGDPVVDDTLPPDKSAEELIRAAEKTIVGLWGHLNRLES